MTVELSGFRREEMNVPIAVNQRVRLDVSLKAGGLAQQVEVTTAVPLLHVSDAAVGEVIDQRQVAELPLNGRQFLELALLVPGAHTSHGAQMGDMSPLYWRPGQNSAITISGARPNSNVYLARRARSTPIQLQHLRDQPCHQTRSANSRFRPGHTPPSSAVPARARSMSSPSRARPRLRGPSTSTCATASSTQPEFTNPDELPPFSQNQFGGTLGGPARAGHFLFRRLRRPPHDAAHVQHHVRPRT